MEMKTSHSPLVEQIAGLAHPCSFLLLRIGLLGLAPGLLSVLLGGPAMAQTGNPLLPNPQVVPVSLPHLYWQFLLSQNRLDRLAAQRQQQGIDASYLRNHYQRELGFTDAQYMLVRSTAQRLETELHAVDGQARAIIQADRAANPVLPGAPHTWRPVPPELKALQQQRGGAIQSEVANLKTALGSELATRMDTFLQKRLSPQAGAQTSHPGPTPDQLRQHLYQAMQKRKGAQQ